MPKWTLHPALCTYPQEKTNGEARSPKICFKSEAWPLMTKNKMMIYGQKFCSKAKCITKCWIMRDPWWQNINNKILDRSQKSRSKAKRNPWRRLVSSLTHHSSPAANIPMLTPEFVIECICIMYFTNLPTLISDCILYFLLTQCILYLIFLCRQHTNNNQWGPKVQESVLKYWS